MNIYETTENDPTELSSFDEFLTNSAKKLKNIMSSAKKSSELKSPDSITRVYFDKN